MSKLSDYLTDEQKAKLQELATEKKQVLEAIKAIEAAGMPPLETLTKELDMLNGKISDMEAAAKKAQVENVLVQKQETLAKIANGQKLVLGLTIEEDGTLKISYGKGAAKKSSGSSGGRRSGAKVKIGDEVFDSFAAAARSPFTEGLEFNPKANMRTPVTNWAKKHGYELEEIEPEEEDDSSKSNDKEQKANDSSKQEPKEQGNSSDKDEEKPDEPKAKS